jgi:hypothetical protein
MQTIGNYPSIVALEEAHSAIPAIRLHNQQIVGTTFNDPKSLVAHMGALQAQDYAMSKWAIGVRLPNHTDAQIEAAFDAGTIVRTHVMRPTWHIVPGQDVRWMLALTASKIKAAIASYDREMNLDAALIARSNDLIAKALEGGKHRTRSELMETLEQGGIATSPSRATHFMFHAEQDAIVCNGMVRGKEQTYALLDEKVPKGVELSREEALSELAKRYFTSHAPVSLLDFQWWSGLGMGDARKALDSIKSGLNSLEHGGNTYFFPVGTEVSLAARTVFFLPAFDEYCVSYKFRDAVFDPAFHKEAITANGIFKPIIVVDGQVVGIWKRTVKPKNVEIETVFFDPSKTL